MSDRGWPRVDTAGAAEEWLDARLHRPLAQQLVRLLVDTPVTPNQVTGIACLFGVLAALLLFLGVTRPSFRFFAGVLLFTAVVFDCADGQLARARHAASRTGDMIDGLADLIVSIGVIAAATYVAVSDRGDPRIWLLGAMALVSQGVQCLLFDYAKRAYLSRAGIRPLPTDADLAQTREAARHAWRAGRAWEAFLLWFYVNYFTTQRAVFAALPGIATADPRRMQTWTWLGLGVHLALLYTAAAASAFWPPALVACLVIFCTIENALLAGLLAM